MNINFKDLLLLPEIYKLLCKLNNNQIHAQKKWLSVKELSIYLTFGKDKIYKMIDVQFIESEHYYKKENRLLFDKNKIDEWVISTLFNKKLLIEPSEQAGLFKNLCQSGKITNT